jgi:hypothetical protein
MNGKSLGIVLLVYQGSVDDVAYVKFSQWLEFSLNYGMMCSRCLLALGRDNMQTSWMSIDIPSGRFSLGALTIEVSEYTPTKGKWKWS